MVKAAMMGALAPLLLLDAVGWAGGRTPILEVGRSGSPTLGPGGDATGQPIFPPLPGANPILPPRFLPMGYDVIEPEAEPAGFVPATTVWALPLFDRKLTQAERTADLAPDLRDAATRIEPMYDPTRLDGPYSVVTMAVSAGTAAMDNVFADRWRLATPDATINLKVAPIATAWQASGPLPCDAFAKDRPHGFGDPGLTALSDVDCRLLLRYQALGYDEAPPIPIVAAPLSLPVFAAPPPGARLSSEDFWAARKARIEAIDAHLDGKWHTDRDRVSEARPQP